MSKTKLTPLPTEKKKTRKQPITKSIKEWVIKEIWNGRPIQWLAIGLGYTAIAFTSYSLAKYYVNIPELNGIATLVSTLIVGGRAFRK